MDISPRPRGELRYLNSSPALYILKRYAKLSEEEPTPDFGPPLQKPKSPTGADAVPIKRFTVETKGRALYDITEEVQGHIKMMGVREGLATLFIHHTSASLLINENADPAVHKDLIAYYDRLVPDGDPLFTHVEEGPDDMSAHVKATLTQVSLGMPIAGGRVDLGRWQGIYLFEHRKASYTRKLTLTVISA